MKKHDYLVAKLQLIPHPEGGFYRETYRSIKNYSTCIYYLLTSDTFSAFHRIKQDEIWHFYSGEPISLHLINPEGAYTKIMIGNNMKTNQIPQFVVPAGYWFAANVESDYALVGCTVSPGFDFSDFELAKKKDLIKQFPPIEAIINRFTR